MKYIKEAQARQEEKQKKEENYNKIKKEVIKNAEETEWKEQKNTESDPLEAYQVGHTMTVCARL